MAWWGKLVGGTFGFMMGGPLGALMGVALGDLIGGGRDSGHHAEHLGFGSVERVQSAFFTTTFSIMGFIAKADGKITKDEIKMAEQVMQQMHLNSHQRSMAINLFDEGKKSDFPAEEVIIQFKKECMRRSNLIQMFLEIQISTALADGYLHKNEKSLLESIAHDLGFERYQFESLLARLQGFANFEDENSGVKKLEAAYELLGVDRTCSDQELKKAYRRQMNQHHPDKLVAKGLPDEMIEIATQKTQDIKAAYEIIKNGRS